jgi:hypothetical protein
MDQAQTSLRAACEDFSLVVIFLDWSQSQRRQMMKKILLLGAAALLMSCGGADLKPDGSFGKEEFVGKFHGVSIYYVYTPSKYANLYIAVKEDGEVSGIQYDIKTKNSIAHITLIDTSMDSHSETSLDEIRKLK